METDVRPDDVVEHETDDSGDSEFEDALEELVLASGVENVNISNNSNNNPSNNSNNPSNNSNNPHNNHPAETGETTSSRSPENREKKIAQEIVSEVIATAKQKVATADDRCHSTVSTSATTDGNRDATVATSATTLLQDARSTGAALYEDIHGQTNAVASGTCDDIAKEPKEYCADEAEDPAETTGVSEENEQEQRDEEGLVDEKDKAEEDEEGEDEKLVVDEEFLKEREANLTYEEKQELKEKAQELKAEGNVLFKENNYVGAVVAYTDALRTCPLACAKERSIMYSNRAACKLHMDQKDSAIEDCTKALELNPNYMKCLLRRAELYEKTDKLDEALGDYQRALEVDPGLHVARKACMRLPEQIKERNEKLKEEMMGKLKDLGNLVLRPFGLSTDNFKLNQDPNTGGYSVAFQQNPGSSS